MADQLWQPPSHPVVAPRLPRPRHRRDDRRQARQPRHRLAAPLQRQPEGFAVRLLPAAADVGGEAIRRTSRGPRRCVAGGSLCCGPPPGIVYVARAGGHVLVRVNHRTLPLWDIEGRPFRLAAFCARRSSRTDREWPTLVRHDGSDDPGRLVVVKRDRWSAALERRALRKRASKKQKKLSRTALFLAGYFLVWTNVPAEAPWTRRRCWPGNAAAGRSRCPARTTPSSEGLYRRDRAARISVTALRAAGRDGASHGSSESLGGPSCPTPDAPSSPPLALAAGEYRAADPSLNGPPVVEASGSPEGAQPDYRQGPPIRWHGRGSTMSRR